jgi:glutaredoxin
MKDIVLYTRRGCHLCEQVEEMLAFHAPGAAVLDCGDSPAWERAYGLRVPVVVVDGVVVIEGRIDEPALVQALAGKPASTARD